MATCCKAPSAAWHVARGDGSAQWPDVDPLVGGWARVMMMMRVAASGGEPCGVQ